MLKQFKFRAKQSWCLTVDQNDVGQTGIIVTRSRLVHIFDLEQCKQTKISQTPNLTVLCTSYDSTPPCMYFIHTGFPVCIQCFMACGVWNAV